MTKPIEKWPDTYDPEVFAKKYGLTLKQAKTSSVQPVLPSKVATLAMIVGDDRVVTVVKAPPLPPKPILPVLFRTSPASLNFKGALASSIGPQY
ncbi:hypothetical protein CK215_28075 [Mesorhizobium sp. WSM3864]|uniref:hypothetical protein n=1 Tax=unclassified Mesorhizobium TaxID=325217 RepID=UPI000BAEA702|nr:MULTISPECIES: hypothetical protein [unclassified Mesorhizobium]PBB28817.1 hypothetical protein CK214_28970 [Mesorhizobium sp. WSM3882]PBB89366.1 hypothetical protein CK215_28075 [Mesorhizobium sp. WSM3864]